MQRLNLSWKKKKGKLLKKLQHNLDIHTLTINSMRHKTHKCQNIYISIQFNICCSSSLYIYFYCKVPLFKNPNIYCLETTASIMDNPHEKKYPWKEDPYEISSCPTTAPPSQKHTVQYTSNCSPPLNVPCALKVVEILQQCTYKVSAESSGDLKCASIPTESKELEGSN